MGLLFREHPKAQPGRLVFVVVFWRSPGSNLRPLVYKASDLTTAPRRLLYRPISFAVMTVTASLAPYIPIQSRAISGLFHYYGKVYSSQLCR